VSRAAVRAVERNLFRALVYNLVGVALAAGGVLHPVVAAVLMVVSSLTLLFSSSRVGHCSGTSAERALHLPHLTETPSASRVSAHALAFALQGVVLCLLVGALREPTPAAVVLSMFAFAGVALAAAWRRFELPHWADMCFGMLTFGNLGMLVGWWADNGFAPLHDGGCCRCVEQMRDGTLGAGMWVGMLVLANVAMRWLGQRPVSGASHSVAMYSGGNAGMVFGMIAGGWAATAVEFAADEMTLAVGASFAGMTAGMLAGMLAGSWLAERLLSAIFGPAPRSERVNPSRTP
jgi:hypothetical protein